MRVLFAVMVLALGVAVMSCKAGEAPFTVFPVDVMALDPPAVAVTGVRPVERAAGVDHRWLIGPKASLAVNLKDPARLVLSFTASNPLEGQTVTVSAGGKEAARFENIPASHRLTGFTAYKAVLDLPTGPSLIEITFLRYNRRSPEDTFAPEDKEGLALIVSELTLTPAKP